MKQLLAALVLTGISASWASSLELENVPGLKQSLAAIKSQALALKPEAEPAPQKPREGSHRLGHSTPMLPFEAEEVPDISAYAVRGVDVSHHEGHIRWNQMKAAGISFAFIKATEGGGYVDDMFQANWQGASSVGIAKSAYHFYNFCKTGTEQADNFIKTVPREDGALPMVIDLEPSNDCAHMPAKPALLKDLTNFIGKVQAAYGLTPILYINPSIYNEYLLGTGADNKFWIADPSHAAPRMPDGKNWTFWQYAWHGTVAGLSSEVDLDVFNGGAQALSRLTQPQILAWDP